MLTDITVLEWPLLALNAQQDLHVHQKIQQRIDMHVRKDHIQLVDRRHVQHVLLEGNNK